MKKTVTLLLCLMMTLAAFGAFAGGTAYDAISEPITIQWWHALEDQYSPTIQTVLDAFHAQYPLITVEPIYMGGYADVNTQLIAAIAADTAPALTVAKVDYLANYGETGVCEPLMPYVEAYGTDIADFGDGFMETATVNDQLIAMPFLLSTQVIYYNEDAAAEEGIEVPKTWEEMDAFLEKATLFNADGTTQRYGIVFGGWISWYFETLFFNNGVQVICEDGASTDVNGEAGVAIASKIAEWIEKGYATFAYGTNASADLRQKFWGKEAFCVVNTSSLFETFRANADFSLGVAWYPAVDGGIDTSMGGCMLVIPAYVSRAQKDAAYVLAEYLTSKDVNMVWAEDTGYLPTRKSVIGTEEGQAYIAGKPGFDVVFNNLDYIKPCNTNPMYASVSGAWRDALAKVFQEGAPVQSTLDECAKLITEMLED